MARPFHDLFDLSGRVALVTGASRGIGAAIARGLAEFGARVVLSSRKQEGVEAVAAEIRAAGGEAAAIAAHVGDAEATWRLVQQTAERFGGLDILINNAATNPVYGPLLETDAAAFDKILAINLQAPLELARQAHGLLRQRGGSILNVSSVGGLSPEPQLGLYSVSKAGLLSLTKVMASEWAADGIRVNALCPGLVQTKFSAALWQEPATLRRFLQQVPLGRVAQPEEMVGVAIYLASPAASYCTGAAFTVDGGYTI